METSMVKFPLDADIGEVTTVRFITAKGSVFFFFLGTNPCILIQLSRVSVKHLAKKRCGFQFW